MKQLNVILIVKIILTVLLITNARQVETNDDGRKYLPLLMPDVQPVVKETYLCTAFRMPLTDFKYIVEFTPNATMHVAHHILIYGCEIPGRWERDTPRLVWECGEMNGNTARYMQGPTCNSGSQIIYAWAKDAPPLSLPEGVGFKVGRHTGINFLVLQVHYAHVEKFIMGGKDNSGIILTMLPSTTDKVTKSAGVYVLGTGGEIKAGEEEHFEAACKIKEPLTLHPFAFRTHTHALGKAVSGYKIDKDGVWHFIGKHDPQQPQMFYPVEDKSLTIEYGDTLAARCTMYNFRDRDTYVGSTGEDEMCNFYIMYYVEGDKPMDDKYCFTRGPPIYYWIRDYKVGSVPKYIDLSSSTL